MIALYSSSRHSNCGNITCEDDSNSTAQPKWQAAVFHNSDWPHCSFLITKIKGTKKSKNCHNFLIKGT